MIRVAGPEDAPEIARLLEQLGYPASEEQARARLTTVAENADGMALVAERDGRVVGLVGLHLLPFLERDGRWCRVTALVVDEALRGKGIGRELIEEAERVAREKDCRCVEVSSGPRRADAHGFYERLGYEERRRRFQKWLGVSRPGGTFTSGL